MSKNFYSIALVIIIFGGGSTFNCPIKKALNSIPAQPTQNTANYEQCLPDGIEPDTIVSISRIHTETGVKTERETIKQRLDKVKAHCKDGKLVDENAKEIRLYQLQGCWGNPPADAQEILQNQQKELNELKKKYTVIEITCNSSGDMPF